MGITRLAQQPERASPRTLRRREVQVAAVPSVWRSQYLTLCDARANTPLALDCDAAFSATQARAHTGEQPE